MIRRVSVKRLYTLGQFKNVIFEDEFSEIAQEIWMNPEAMRLIRKLQIDGVDASYAQYVLESGVVNKKLATPTQLEEYIELLSNERLTTLENLTEAVASKT